MKRKILFVFALLLCMIRTVSAAPDRVVDSSGLLSEQERASLTAYADSVSNQYGIDIVVVTVDTLDGKGAMEYADDYYDYNGYGDDGVLLLVCMDARLWWISTSGACIQVIDNGVIDDMSDRFTPRLSSGSYYDAFRVFIDDCGSAMEAETGFNIIPVLVCIGIGVLVGLIVVLVMKAQMKNVRRQSSAGSYIRNGSMQVNVSRDMFLYQNVTRRLKPQNNSTGTHMGSSGRSHGGGGGRF